MNRHHFVYWVPVSIAILSGCSEDTGRQAGQAIEVNALIQQPAEGESFRESEPPTDSASGTLPTPLPKHAANLAATSGEGVKPQDSQTTEAQFTIRVELDSSEDPPAVEIEKPLRIVVTNTSNNPLRIWNPRMKNGYSQWTMRFTDPKSRKVNVVTRRRIEDPQYWEMLHEENAEAIEIAPKDTFTFRVRLHDFLYGRWDKSMWVGLPSPNLLKPLVFTVIFESRLKAPRGDPPVWIGIARSQELTVQLIASRMKTPHDYLRHGFPESALEMMKADKQWIRRKNENVSTPLHLAAGCGSAKVVRWLLQNGADVNAIGFNGCTPLHGALTPEVLKLILEHKPDLTIRNRIYGHTPLQTVAAAFVEANDAERKEELRGLIKIYLEAGADYDPLVAIRLNDLARLKSILRQFPNLADNFQNQSLLRMAASLGRMDICRYLIEQHHVDVDDFERGVGYPILMEAWDYPEVLRLLIDNGADLKTRITWRGGRSGPWLIGDDATALHHAASRGAPETVELLLDSGVSLIATAQDSHDPSGKQTALDIAAFFGKAGNVVTMLNHPQFDQLDAQLRQRVLDKALIRGVFSLGGSKQPQIVRALLDKGADPTVTRLGDTLVPLAVRSIHPTSEAENESAKQVVSLLVERGAPLDLFSAVTVGDEAEVSRMLQENPEAANEKGPEGPLLHVAVKMNYVNVVQSILGAGGDVNVSNAGKEHDAEHETALHVAAFWSRPELAKLLIESGAKVNALDEAGRTPLHVAVARSNLPLIRLLLERGAQVDAQDEEGITPLERCRKFNRNNPDAVEKLLREFGADDQG